MPTKKSKPTTNDIANLLPSIHIFANNKDRIARAKMLWYEIHGEQIPPEVACDAELSLSEYHQYVAANFPEIEVPKAAEKKVAKAKKYKLSDVIEKLNEELKIQKRTAYERCKNYCTVMKIDFPELKKSSLNNIQASALYQNLKNWANPKSRKTAASNASKVRVALQYAKNHSDDFHEYVENIYNGEVRESILIPWMKIRDGKIEYKKLSLEEKNLLRGPMRDFHGKNSKKHFVKKQTARKAKK